MIRPITSEEIELEISTLPMGFPGGAVVKNLPANAGDARDKGSIPGLRRCPWSRKWQPTPIFLPGKLHCQRSLAGYSPWSRKELDRTVCTHTHTHTLPVKKKSLGLDGFNGKVYQKFQEELISTLVKLFQKLKKAVMLETQCIRLATP